MEITTGYRGHVRSLNENLELIVSCSHSLNVYERLRIKVSYNKWKGPRAVTHLVEVLYNQASWLLKTAFYRKSIIGKNIYPVYWLAIEWHDISFIYWGQKSSGGTHVRWVGCLKKFIKIRRKVRENRETKRKDPNEIIIHWLKINLIFRLYFSDRKNIKLNY